VISAPALAPIAHNGLRHELSHAHKYNTHLHLLTHTHTYTRTHAHTPHTPHTCSLLVECRLAGPGSPHLFGQGLGRRHGDGILPFLGPLPALPFLRNTQAVQQALLLAQTCARVHTLTHAHMHTHTHTHTHTLARTYTDTHTHLHGSCASRRCACKGTGFQAPGWSVKPKTRGLSRKQVHTAAGPADPTSQVVAADPCDKQPRRKSLEHAQPHARLEPPGMKSRSAFEAGFRHGCLSHTQPLCGHGHPKWHKSDSCPVWYESNSSPMWHKSNSCPIWHALQQPRGKAPLPAVVALASMPASRRCPFGPSARTLG